MIYMRSCSICPVIDECISARRVAIKSVGDADTHVLEVINRICPIEEMMYATFLIAIHNAEMEVANV